MKSEQEPKLHGLRGAKRACKATRYLEEMGCMTRMDVPVQEKNVAQSMLEGKVGRIYMPRQELESVALRKMKVTRRLIGDPPPCPPHLSQQAFHLPAVGNLVDCLTKSRADLVCFFKSMCAW